MSVTRNAGPQWPSCGARGARPVPWIPARGRERTVSSCSQVPSALGRKPSNSAHEAERKPPGKEKLPVPKTALALPGQPINALTPGGPAGGQEETPGVEGGWGWGRVTALNSQQESTPSQAEATKGCPAPARVRFAITSISQTAGFVAGVWFQLYPLGLEGCALPSDGASRFLRGGKGIAHPSPEATTKTIARVPPRPLPHPWGKVGVGGGARVCKPLVKSSPDGPHRRVSQWTCSRRKPQDTFQRARCRLGRGGSEEQREVSGSVSGGKLCAVLAAGGSGWGGSGGGSGEVRPRPRRHAVPGAACTGRPHLGALIPSRAHPVRAGALSLSQDGSSSPGATHPAWDPRPPQNAVTPASLCAPRCALPLG